MQLRRWSIHDQISCGKVPPILHMLLMHWKQSTRSDFKSQLPYVPTFDVLEVEDKHSRIIIGAISPRKNLFEERGTEQQEHHAKASFYNSNIQ
jgi:hypothetical protein